jgi:hypothetical protein
MNGEINYFEHFYQQASQDPDMLERNANDYPYCSLAGFLLLYHYKKTNHPGFEKLAKKTALQFKNSNWLQFLLDQTLNEKTAPEIISPKYSEEETKELNEIIPEEVTQTLYGQNSGNEIEEVTENKPLPVEDFEIPHQMEITSEAAPEISQEQNFQKKYTEEDPETAEPRAGEISFEPLHTVDYFASQGIKITEEPVTTDKLGNQMKSFTAWLKSMKKLHPSKLEERDVVTDRLIQNSAEESNINTEVLTEAMAEVLIKQDKREKAIEMYNKLSLINPSKSAYFATKIESIKSS